MSVVQKLLGAVEGVEHLGFTQQSVLNVVVTCGYIQYIVYVYVYIYIYIYISYTNTYTCMNEVELSWKEMETE